MSSTAAARIVTELHDEPHIKGRRVTVRRIQGLVEGASKSPPTVADDLQIDLSDVYAALHFYHTHPEEIDDAEQQRAEREQDLRKAGAASLNEYKLDGEENGPSSPD